MKYFIGAIFFLFTNAWAQGPCVPGSSENTKVVASGSIKTVEGILADFDPCHRSVQLSMPSIFAKKRGEKPPVVIIAHGGIRRNGFREPSAGRGEGIVNIHGRDWNRR